MLSILIPAYKAQNFLVETIMSLKNQTLMIDYEIIVVIDGCEATRDAVKHLHNNNTKIYYCPENRGRYIASNTAVKLSRGDEYLMFDGDDIAAPTLFEEIYDNNDNIDLMRFGYQKFQDKLEKVFPEMRELGVVRKDIFSYKKRRVFGKESNGCANGIVWMRKAVMDCLGGYKSWECSADTEFLHRFRDSDFKEKCMVKPLFLYRQHGNSLTNSVAMRKRYYYHSLIKNHYGKTELKINAETNTGKFVSNRIN